MDGSQNKMNKVIHAHTLMDFMQENPQLSSLDELKVEFEKQFGEVHFTNCTNQVYNFDEIIQFLFQRNKVRHNQEGVEVINEHRCEHE